MEILHFDRHLRQIRTILLICSLSVCVNVFSQTEIATKYYLNLTEVRFDSINSIIINQAKFTELPQNIVACKNLETLIVIYSEKRIKNIDLLCQLTKLNEINLSYCRIVNIPVCFNKLNLRKLSLRGNQVEYIDSGFRKQYDLQELDLKFNPNLRLDDLVKNLPVNLKKLSLTLSKRSLSDMSNLKQIDSLDLSYSKKVKLSDNIMALANCDSLKIVNFSHSKFKNTSIGNTYPKNIKKLDLSYSKLNKLPQSIANLNSLEELNISGNKLKYSKLLILKDMKNLRILKIYDNATLSENNILSLQKLLPQVVIISKPPVYMSW